MVNLKFWQKDDDPFQNDSLDESFTQNDFSQDFATPTKNNFSQTPTNNSQDPLNYNPENHPPGVSFTPAENNAPPNNAGGKNTWQYDVIIARLDSIKSQLDVLTHRLERLEEQKKAQTKNKGPWYTK